MENVLTDAQVQQFRADGLLLIPGLIRRACTVRCGTIWAV